MAKTKMARNAKGRFVKQSSASKALVRRGSSSVVVVRSAPLTKAQAKKKGRRRGAGKGAGVLVRLKSMAPELAASAAYAFVTRGKSPTAAKVNAYVKKVPIIAAIGAPATHGLLALLIASNTSGTVRKVADYTAVAALHQAAANLGATSGDFKAAALLAGVDDDVEMGSMGDDDIGDDDDEDVAA